MAKNKDKIFMPSGMGGLIRYPEEEKDVIKLKPKHIIWIVIGLAIFELAIKLIL